MFVKPSIEIKKKKVIIFWTIFLKSCFLCVMNIFFFLLSSLGIENEVILSPVFVREVVLDGGGQVEVVDLALLDALLVDVLTNHTTAKVHQRKRLS